MNRSLRHAALGLTFLALGASVEACSSASKAGNVGEDCYPNGTCNETLTCQAGKCVAAGSSGAGGHTASSSSSSGNVTSSSSGTASSSSGTATSSSSSSGTGGQTTTSSSSGGSTGNAPQILVLGTDVQTITEGEVVTFTAVVTDPDGIDDVIGGTLGDGNGDYYGAFATSGQEGAYQMVVSWAQIDQVASINIATGATATRTFVAEFYDQAGHTTQKSVTVSLSCLSIAACGGKCIDVSQDSDNCGACGQACAGGVPCFKSHCAALGTCNVSTVTTCTAACAAAGKTCADKCGPGNVYGGVYYSAANCVGTATNALCATSVTAAPSTKCCCF